MYKKVFLLFVKYVKFFLWNLKQKKSKQQYFVSDNSGTITLSTFGDIPRVLFINSHYYRFKKSFEYKTISLLELLSRNANIIIDVGANVGLMSIIMAKNNRNAKIIAFEPSSETSFYLRMNLQLNDISNVIVYNKALSEKKDKLLLHVPNTTFKNFKDSFKTLQLSKTNNELNLNESELVDVETLDNFITEEKISTIDLIKVDIEGAELFFFKGAKNYFTTTKQLPIIVFENTEHNNKNFDYTVADCLVYLSQFGYKIFNYDSEQWVAYPEAKSSYIEKIVRTIGE